MWARMPGLAMAVGTIIREQSRKQTCVKDLTCLIPSCLFCVWHLMFLNLGAEPTRLLYHTVLLSGLGLGGEQVLLADSGVCDLRTSPSILCAPSRGDMATGVGHALSLGRGSAGVTCDP